MAVVTILTFALMCSICTVCWSSATFALVDRFDTMRRILQSREESTTSRCGCEGNLQNEEKTLLSEF